MVNLKKIFIPVIICTVYSVAVMSQRTVKPRINGLEKDSVYMSLLMKETLLKNREDSIANVIELRRQQFVDDSTSKRVLIGNNIIKLEAQLFDVKNSIGVVASKTNTIEQEFLMKNIGTTQNIIPQQRKQENLSNTNNKNLISNDYFLNNISKQEYDDLIADQKMEKNLIKLTNSFSAYYSQLADVAKRYENVSSQVYSDSVFGEYQNINSKINALEKTFNSKWEKIYNDKIYIYSYILDKLNKNDILLSLNQKSKEIKVSEDLASQPISVAFANYPTQKALVIAYERAIAEVLEYTKATDSLKIEIKTLEKLNLSMPKIIITPKDFVDFSSVTIKVPAIYNSKNPIPTIDIPPKGKYYSITIGTFSSAPAITTFKGATPLYKEILTDWRTRYFTGIFRTLGDALDSHEILKDNGFKRPEIVMWNDGTYKNLAADMLKNSGEFRVEINGIGNDVSENVKHTIEKYAKNQELTRVGDTYYVGVFTNMMHAQELYDALIKIDGIKAKVVKLNT